MESMLKSEYAKNELKTLNELSPEFLRNNIHLVEKACRRVALEAPEDNHAFRNLSMVAMNRDLLEEKYDKRKNA